VPLVPAVNPVDVDGALVKKLQAQEEEALAVELEAASLSQRTAESLKKDMMLQDLQARITFLQSQADLRTATPPTATITPSAIVLSDAQFQEMLKRQGSAPPTVAGSAKAAGATVEVANKYDKFMSTAVLRVAHDVYQDPVLFGQEHRERVRDSQLTGANRDSTRLGNTNIFVGAEQEVQMNPLHLHSPSHFLEGFLFYIQLCAESVPAVRAKVADRLEFFRQAWYYGPVSRQTVKYIKQFMHLHAKDLDWADLFRADAVNVNRYMRASTLAGYSGGDYYGGDQPGLPQGIYPSRATYDHYGESTSRQRGSSDRRGPDRDRQSKRSKPNPKKAASIGGGSATSKLFCMSRTIVTHGACTFDPNCRFSHACPCHPSEYHSAKACQESGNWDSAKAAAAIAASSRSAQRPRRGQ
jgi:hypothetical protein